MDEWEHQFRQWMETRHRQPLRRKYKRAFRKAWFVRWPELKARQKSRGFARHVRKLKAA